MFLKFEFFKKTYLFKLLKKSPKLLPIIRSHLTAQVAVGITNKCGIVWCGVRWTVGGGKGKGKAIPLQALTGPEGSRKLRLPDFKTIGI
jgi:hypothetical protein